MGARTSYAPGTFCWTDLSTGDLEGAIAFYEALFGWRADVEDTPGGGPYAAFVLDGRRVAGAFGGKRSEWLSYVTVDDVDASASRAEELGADVVAGPRDVADLGRVAYLTDPLGAAVGLWQPGSAHGAEVVNEPGALTWNELVCPSIQAAKGFYGDLLGWTWRDVLGTATRYSVIVQGERKNGGLMEMPDTPAHWRPYFVVERCDAAGDRLRELGGKVLFGPWDVPNGRFLVALDPQGAIFAAYEGQVDD